jgi:IS5 family transposase
MPLVYDQWLFTCKAKGDGTMKRRNRGESLSNPDKFRNIRISKIRSRIEHVYGIMDRMFHAGRTKLTTVPRVFVQQLFICLAYNVNRIKILV